MGEPFIKLWMHLTCWPGDAGHVPPETCAHAGARRIHAIMDIEEKIYTP